MSLSLNFVWACSKKNVQKLNYRNKKALKNYRENNNPFLQRVQDQMSLQI